MKPKEWHEQRRLGIGGSQVYDLLHNRRKLWNYIQGIEEEPDEPTPDMRRGTETESIHRRLYTEKTGRQIVNPQPHMLHPNYPWIRANMDGIILDELGGVQSGVLELKAPRSSRYYKIIKSGVPERDILQVNWYMLFPGIEWASLSYFSVDAWEITYFDIEPDKELQAILISESKAFWNLVEKGEPPDEEDIEVPVNLPELSAQEELVIDNSDMWKRAVFALKEARDIRQEGELLESEAKDKISFLMGENQIVEGGGARIYNKWQEGRKSLDKKLLARDYPDIDFGKYEKQGKPFRTFKPYFMEES